MAGGYEVGKAYVTIIPSTKGFGKGIGDTVLPETEKTGTEAGSKFGSGMQKGFSKVTGVIAGVVSAVASKGLDVISNSMSSAISRVDTLNNFPRVLTSLGYSANDADAAINKMSEHITGLPTTLDSMAGSVQKILPSVKNVDKASDIMLAFNDALLAGGQSTEMQQSAIEQFSQALAKGKPELQDWRTIEQAMPGQLDQVAQAMLGNTANANDLYEALKDGSVSMDDFNNALIDLDKNGSNGIASFADQAKAALGGIRTQINLIGTRISKGIGNVIQAIGVDKFTAPLQAISSGVDIAFNKIIDIVNKTKDVFGQLSQTPQFTELSNAATRLGGVVVQAFRDIVQTVKDYVKEITGIQNTGDLVKKLSDIMSSAADGINKAANALNKLTNWCRDHSKELETAAVSIGVFAGALKTLKTASSVIAGVSKALGALSGAAGEGGLGAIIGLITAHPVAAIIAAIAAAIAGLVYWFTQTDSGKQALSDIMTALQPVIDGVSGFFQNIWPIVQAGLQVASDILQQIGQVIMPILQDAWNQLTEAFQQPWFQNLIQGIQIIFGFLSKVVQFLMPFLMAAIQTLMDNLPQIIQIVGDIFTFIITAIGDFIVAVVSIAATIFSIAANIVARIINFVSSLIGFIINAVKALGDGIVVFIQSLISGIFNIISGIVSFITGIANIIIGIATGNFDLIKDGVSGMVDGIKNIVKGIADILTAPFKAAFTAIKKLWNSTIGGFEFTVPDWIPGVGGKGFKIPKLAKGGDITSGGTVMVGEAGPEILSLPRGARVTPLDHGTQGGAIGDTYNLQFGNVNLSDKRAAQQATKEYIEYLVRISA